MLDVAGHLSSFGWKGKGTALREGAITRPLLVSQKKSLSGLGKDRDEAYPFWDHVFAAAAKTITIKIAGSDDGRSQSSDEEGANSKLAAAGPIARTKTGIISNRRPTTTTTSNSTCATPGDTTPELVPDSDAGPGSRLSIMSQAKREAAKRALYARFYRGPVLKSEIDAELERDEPAKKKKKRKRSEDEEEDEDGNVGTHWRTLAAAVTAPVSSTDEQDAGADADKAARKLARAERKAARAERRALRAAKREAKRLKEEKKAKARKTKEAEAALASAPAVDADADDSGKKKKTKKRSASAVDDAVPGVDKPGKKKKRKTEE